MNNETIVRIVKYPDDLSTFLRVAVRRQQFSPRWTHTRIGALCSRLNPHGGSGGGFKGDLFRPNCRTVE